MSLTVDDSSLNRYSMPVTRSRSYMAELNIDNGLDGNNTTGFLFGDEDSNNTAENKNFHQASNMDNFPTLVRREGFPTMVSLFPLFPLLCRPFFGRMLCVQTVVCFTYFLLLHILFTILSEFFLPALLDSLKFLHFAGRYLCIRMSLYLFSRSFFSSLVLFPDPVVPFFSRFRFLLSILHIQTCSPPPLLQTTTRPPLTSRRLVHPNETTSPFLCHFCVNVFR